MAAKGPPWGLGKRRPQEDDCTKVAEGPSGMPTGTLLASCPPVSGTAQGLLRQAPQPGLDGPLFLMIRA